MQFTDGASVAGTRLTDDGYLIADARCVRTGVQFYRASEIGLIGDDIVGVYRPEAEVFHKDSLTSFGHAPVTMDHPAEPVTAETWKAVAIGETGDEVLRDGERLRIPLIVKDAAAIVAIKGGKREISAGYTCTLDHTPGTAPDGTPYVAVQRGIRANHIAIVAKGRAGAECRIGDADAWGASPVTMSDKKEDRMSDALKTVVLGDEAVQVAVADAAKIDKWKADQAKALADAQAANDKALATKDADLAKKDAEIADLKKQVLSDADLDARVQARADLVGKAKALVKDIDTAGKSDADIRKAVVIAKRGAEMADKSAAYIDAAFDLLAEAAPVDPVRGALKDAKPEGDHNADYRKALSDAWKTPVKEA
ncbi:DUF2213 domain-containing protein [Paracoccus sp. p4-l81]|uniref:DUF2213 domain-containing protein n=1 Tax=Paracoccus sp. p4-l81 TaxID=3342806 RepID=UPI0035B7A19B